MALPNCPGSTENTRSSPSHEVVAKQLGSCCEAQAMLEMLSLQLGTDWSGLMSFLQSSRALVVPRKAMMILYKQARQFSFNRHQSLADQFRLSHSNINKFQYLPSQMVSHRNINQMPTIRFISLAVLLTCVASVKIFMFGGVLVDDNNPAYRQLILETGKPTRLNCDQNWDTTDCPRVAVITSACPDSACGQEEYYTGDGEEMATQQFFLKLGMAPKHISVQIDNYQQSTNLFTVEGYRNYVNIEMADIIYFNGGDQSRHIRCWLNDDNYPNPIFAVIKRKVYNNQAILVTVSAGTAAMASTTYGGGSPFGILYFSRSQGLAPLSVKDNYGMNDIRNGSDCLQYDENGARLKSFGFVDFAVDTHFDVRGRLGRLVPAMKELNTTVGVGIDEYACLYIKDGVGTVYGRNGVFIVDTSVALPVQSQYFGIKNIKLNYLSAGDNYNFKTKKMTTTKSPITPTISGFSDSTDILSDYECTRLLTRLIDQLGSQNLGKTRIPEDEDYPKGTPFFDLLFYKDASTKGYKAGSAYAAENIWLDVSAQVRS